MKTGLNKSTSIGRAGAYRPWADHSNSFQLCTCVAREMDFQAVHHQEIVHLGGPVLPLDHGRRHLGSSWTGRSYAYTWEGGGFDVHLTCTLPGPLFIPHGTTLHFRFAVDNGVPRVRDLETGAEFLASWTNADLGRIILLENWGVPSLLISSSPIQSMKWVSHEHLTITVADERANILWVPLLKSSDVPSDPETMADWIRLVTRPPVECQEFFESSQKSVNIRQEFIDPLSLPTEVSPLPSLLQLSPLSKRPEHKRLIHGLLGPYSLVRGSSYAFEIDMNWASARLEQTRAVAAEGLSPIPQELAYAGDVTWEPGSAMDQFLSLRIWAPLAGVTPASVWERLRPQLVPPTAAAVRDSLTTFVEPMSGRTWAKEAKLFELAGDISYDTDWYNGFELSGLGRAAGCADPAIAELARALSREIRPEREHLSRYFEIFHDWELGAAWSDSRGAGWNTDCSHNGLEGILAEASLRKLEGDSKGADFLWYLAAKTASALLAAEWLAEYAMEVGFFRSHDASPCSMWVSAEGVDSIPRGAPFCTGEPTFGLESVYMARGASIQSTSSKNPYAVAPHFPEFNALQRAHGRVDRYREVVSVWTKKHPKRYADWVAFYCGVPDPSLDASAIHSQEARVQAAVMYHLAPEVCFRLWTLGEDPDSIEGLFQTPLNLAEQLLCRSGMKVV